MTSALVGYTGFVGGNLCRAGHFDGLYNSRNIKTAYGTRPDLLFYAGVRAEKYVADKFPEKDMEAMEEALSNMQSIAPKKLVLISTIDVLADSVGADEDTPASGKGAYGENRAWLEREVRRCFPDCLIVRLPALFGQGLKKNFVYDMMHPLPHLLNEGRMSFLRIKWAEGAGEGLKGIDEYYKRGEDGFYRLCAEGEKAGAALLCVFEKAGFTSLSFTDSRSVFQFYPLRRLNADIMTALDNRLTVFHAAVEEVQAGELYTYVTGKEWHNETAAGAVHYGFCTKYARMFGGEGGCIMRKAVIMEEIKKFVLKGGTD